MLIGNDDDSEPEETPEQAHVTRDFPTVSEKTANFLKQFSPMYEEEYRSFKEDFIDWLLHAGKNPRKRQGYNQTTTRVTHYKIDQAYRWLWHENEEFQLEVTPEDATDLIEHVAYNTPHPDSTVYTFEKSVKRLFKYYDHTQPGHDDLDWDHDVELENQTGGDTHQRDRFFPKEFRRLYQAAIDLHSVKSYDSKMPDEERDAIKAHLAQRLEKPKSEIGAKEFKEANSWKFPSLIAVACDTGLRPIEIERMETGMFNLEHNQLIIPKEKATKAKQRWECGLSDRTSRTVARWLDERQAYDKYDGTDAMWLTKYGNPYTSTSLNRLLDRLMEEADIDQSGRTLSFYSIRHGVATAWCEEKGVYKAKQQLRHKSIDTTLRYTRGSGEVLSRESNNVW